MRTEKIVWGLILIFVGTIFLLDNMNVIDFYWRSVWRFWPVIFILIGANMLLSRMSDSKLATILIALITILSLGFIGFQGTKEPHHKRWLSFDHDDREDRNLSSSDTSTFTAPYEGASKARLIIQGGATSYRLSDTTASLFDAEVKRRFGKYILNKSTDDSVEVINFRMRDNKRSWRLEELEGNETRLKMNKNPEWDIKVEMGAGEAIFDLREYKVSTLKFEGGAASFETKIGSKLPLTNVSVETGVANVEIEIPETSACRIVVDSGLSSKDFIGFVKQADGTYKTPNYNTAENKIHINLKGGLSSFEVRKY